MQLLFFVTLHTGPDLAAADEASEAGLSSSLESGRSGRAPTDRDELLPSRPVRTFNLQTVRQWFNTDVGFGLFEWCLCKVEYKVTYSTFIEISFNCIRAN